MRNGRGVVDCWISWQKGRRVQAGAAERGQGAKAAEPVPSPIVDLWPACSCRDEYHGFNQPLNGRHHPTAQPFCAMPVVNTSTKPFVFWRCFVRMDFIILISPQ